MPDFNLEVFADCDSCKSFKIEIDGYTVRHCRQPVTKSYQYDFECTCEEFNQNPYAYCKHIKKAEEQFCGWSQFVNGGQPINNGDGVYLCPKCKETVTFSRYAI